MDAALLAGHISRRIQSSPALSSSRPPANPSNSLPFTRSSPAMIGSIEGPIKQATPTKHDAIKSTGFGLRGRKLAAQAASKC